MLERSAVLCNRFVDLFRKAFVVGQAEPNFALGELVVVGDHPLDVAFVALVDPDQLPHVKTRAQDPGAPRLGPAEGDAREQPAARSLIGEVGDDRALRALCAARLGCSERVERRAQAHRERLALGHGLSVTESYTVIHFTPVLYRPKARSFALLLHRCHRSGARATALGRLCVNFHQGCIFSSSTRAESAWRAAT